MLRTKSHSKGLVCGLPTCPFPVSFLFHFQTKWVRFGLWQSEVLLKAYFTKSEFFQISVSNPARMLVGNYFLPFIQESESKSARLRISGQIYPGETLSVVAWVPKRTAHSQFSTHTGGRELQLPLSTTEQLAYVLDPSCKGGTHLNAHLCTGRCSYLECSRGPKTNKGCPGCPRPLLGQTLPEGNMVARPMLLPTLLPSPFPQSLGPCSCFVVSSLWFDACQTRECVRLLSYACVVC